MSDHLESKELASEYNENLSFVHLTLMAAPQNYKHIFHVFLEKWEHEISNIQRDRMHGDISRLSKDEISVLYFDIIKNGYNNYLLQYVYLSKKMGYNSIKFKNK